MADEFSQKEENTFRKELFRRMDNQDIILNKLLDQTTKTNGRVTKLEDKTENLPKDVAELKTSRIQLITAVSVLMFLGSTIIYFVNKDIDHRITDAVKICSNCVAK